MLILNLSKNFLYYVFDCKKPRGARLEKEASSYTKEFNVKEAFECVFIHKNGKALIRSVETGIQDDQNIEIISGLNEGDEVIKAPYSAVSKKLRNEMPISLEN